jgi:death-on-curing protein
MLVHLDKNKLGLFDVAFNDLFEMVLAVATHTIGLKGKDRVDDQVGRRNPDDEVRAIAKWLEDKADKLKRGERIITYRELKHILSGFGYQMEKPVANTIEIVKYEKRKVGLIIRREKEERKHITTIAYPGSSKEVAIARIKEVRKICRLREEDGIDSTSFYDQTIVIDHFINRYRTILRRLANR